MSNTTSKVEQPCTVSHAGNAIELLIEPKEKDLGGFSVRRLLPTVKQKMVGPWIFFDHMGPATFAPGPGINVRPHPHIGLATVTYLFEGEILHRDSLGSLQPIRPGDINLMVAGKGITHSERETPAAEARQRTLNGLQLWLALPTAQEQIEPAFYHYPAEEIPKIMKDTVPVHVIMGSAYGVTSPVKTFADTLYLEASLNPGEQLELPPAPERAIYVVEGEVNIGEQTVTSHSMAVLKPGAIAIKANQPTTLALIGGEPLGKRFIEWNFVSSNKEAIEQAKEDWKNQRFDKVVDDEEEFIPLP